MGLFRYNRPLYISRLKIFSRRKLALEYGINHFMGGRGRRCDREMINSGLQHYHEDSSYTSTIFQQLVSNNVSRHYFFLSIYSYL